MTRIDFHFLYALIPSLLVSCTAEDPAAPLSTTEPWHYQYRVPVRTEDGWETGSLEEVGLSVEPFVDLMTDLHQNRNHLVHSLLIVRNGRLVFEEYFSGQKFKLGQYTGETGFSREDTHDLASATKSITTTLLGIALYQGMVDSVHDLVFDFFPEYSNLLEEDPRRADITIEHLMLMTSGMAWNDHVIPYTDPTNDMVRMYQSSDPIRSALSTELTFAPGTDFEYCNANTIILGEIVHRATGRRLDQFSWEELFSPLGTTYPEWQFISGDFVLASGEARLKPRDMAKFGKLILDDGLWHGEEVVPSAWIQEATSRITIPNGPHAWAVGYGYGWWHWDLPREEEVIPVIMAAGWGGQWILIVPTFDLVVVTTGGAYFTAPPFPAERILSEYVFEAVR